MTTSLLLLLWFAAGILGWLLIIYAYKKLEGDNPQRKWHQLPGIPAGPIAIIMGIAFLWDIAFDPPKK
jgi:hypothetical protein